MTLAPPLHMDTWINAPEDYQPGLADGKVTVLHAFQMLCPGCILHGLPQTQKIYETFSPDQVQVIGLHCVFEHHESMNKTALQAFVSEFKYSFPIGVDQTTKGPLPRTMQAYQLGGTPSLIIIDGAGTIRHHHFGKADDMAVGAAISQLIHHPVSTIKEDLIQNNQVSIGCHR